MFRMWLVLGGLSLGCLTASAAGQSIAPLRLGVALGPAFGQGKWWWPDGGHAALSLTSQQAGSRVGLRVEAMVDHNSNGSRGADGVSHERRHQTIGLTINTTYRLLGDRTGLYAIAGVGVYQRSSELRIQDIRTGEEVRTFSNAAVDANVGLGFNFMALGREMFVESRLHGSAFMNRVPVSVGIRF